MPQQRNARIITALIGAMIIAAGALRLLEPPQPAWASAPADVDHLHSNIEAVEIEYVAAGTPVDLSRFDCLIYADGAHEWRPRSTRVRVGVVGGASGALSPLQSKKLLAVLGSMWQSHGLDLARVELDPNSDPRQRPDVPAPARDLYSMLVRKGIVN